jgi:PilZ domain
VNEGNEVLYISEFLKTCPDAVQDDRRVSRTALNYLVSLRPSGEKPFNALLIDISIAGFACEVVTGMKPGMRCWLNLPGMSGLQAHVVWNDGVYVGCGFVTLMNQAALDSFLARQRPR